MIELIALIVSVFSLIFGSGIWFRIRRARAKRKAAQTLPSPIQVPQSNSGKDDSTPSKMTGSISQEALAQTGFSDSIQEIEQEREIASALGKIGFDGTIRAITKGRQEN
jgi:hypothetical protein